MFSSKRIMGILIAAGLLLSAVSTYVLLSMEPAQANSKYAKVHQDSNHVTKYVATSKAAFAAWSEEDENEVYTDVFVSLFDSATLGNDSYPNSYLDIFISQYRLVEVCDVYYGEEYCYYNYEPLLEFYGFAQLDSSDFAISNSLRSASVSDVEVTGFDYISYDKKTITVAVTWTGKGIIFKEKFGSHISTPFVMFSFKGMGSVRDASSSVDIGGDLEISLDQNSEYNDASISKFKQATMEIIKKGPYDGETTA
ncbi:MAG: hypothetical protein ACREAZ_05940 [Nitrososphaera sp.]